MSDGARLLLVLGELRRRARVQAGLQGSVAGMAVGLGAAIVGRLGALASSAPLLEGFRGPLTTLLALGAAGTVAGFVAGAARRVALEACARRLDESLGRRSGSEGHNGDRTLVALALMQQRAGGAFVQAALRDAARVAGGMGPSMIAPWRRPHGSLAMAGLALFGAALWLGSSSGARARAIADSGQTGAGAEQRGVESWRTRLQAEIERLRSEVVFGRDPRLRPLLDELARLARETRSQDGARLNEELARVAARARQAAREGDEGRRLARALERAAQPLAEGVVTRAAARALAAADAAAVRAAFEHLAAGLGVTIAGEGSAGLGTALARSAAAVRGEDTVVAPSGGEGGSFPAGQSEGRSPRAEKPAAEPARPSATEAETKRPPPTAPEERRLRSLERGLDEGATLCRRDPVACAEAIRRAGEAAEAAARDVEQSRAGERLADAVDRLRGRMGGGTGGPAAGDPGQRDFERRARAQPQVGGGGGASSGARGGITAGGSGREGETGSRAPGRGSAGDGENGAATATAREGNAPAAGTRAGQAGTARALGAGRTSGSATGARALGADNAGETRGGARALGEDTAAGETGGARAAASDSAAGQGRREGGARAAASDSAAGQGRREGAAAAAEDGSGAGTGSAASEAPLGPAAQGLPAARGRATTVAVATGPGPSRAEVIEGSAEQGFARVGYARVYREYEAAIEEALDTAHVPAGRRAVVRRYFELLRPR